MLTYICWPGLHVIVCSRKLDCSGLLPNGFIFFIILTFRIGSLGLVHLLCIVVHVLFSCAYYATFIYMI